MNLVYDLIITIITLGAIYTVVPNLFLYVFALGVWKRQYTSGVALTFDDGPNPEATPQILDILDEYKIKATFFLTGLNSLRYPELVREIDRRGHIIGAHSKSHKFACFISPLETWREWEECISIIENLIHKPVQFVRPPWGTFNFVMWFWMKLRKKSIFLWSAEGHDWQVKRSPERIASRVLRRINGGCIVLLHDAGGDKGAPLNTIKALKIICSGVLKKKLPMVILEPTERLTVHQLGRPLFKQ